MVKYTADEMFAALGHPIRRRMVERLARSGKVSLSDLAEPFSISLPAVLKHAEVLEKSGLIVSSKEGRVRYYAADVQALSRGMEWFRAMEQQWENRLDRLDAHLTRHNGT